MNLPVRNGHARQACWAVIPAAGGGTRMGADRPKQYLPLAGKTVIRHVLERFGRHPRIAGIVVALAPNDEYACPVIHETAHEAQIEIAESMIRRLQQFLAGERDFADAITSHDFVLPVAVLPNATIQIQDGRRFDTR